MSIYATIWDTDSYDHSSEPDNFCGKWKRIRKGSERWARAGLIRSDGHRYWLDYAATCTCRCGLIRYEGSHVLPEPDSSRTASIEIAAIPGHITRDGRDEGPADDDNYWPFLRLSIGDRGGYQTVVLPAEHVQALHEALSGWLENVR